MNYENVLIEMIKTDSALMTILNAVQSLNLPDSWICAGVLRNKVWDYLHNFNTPLNDIDVIYYQKEDISIETEKHFEAQLQILIPNLPWSVKNQARMHEKNRVHAYKSSLDGISHFPETATAIGARLNAGQIEIIAPHGLSDLFELRLCPAPKYLASETLHPIYLKRIKSKKWEDIWTKLTLVE